MTRPRRSRPATTSTRSVANAIRRPGGHARRRGAARLTTSRDRAKRRRPLADGAASAARRRRAVRSCPGQPFGSRYHIIRTLGIGGMGAVYQAWDAELGVAVAMKVIRPEVMADPDGGRGSRAALQARAAARAPGHPQERRPHSRSRRDRRHQVHHDDRTSTAPTWRRCCKREGTLLGADACCASRARSSSGLVEAHKTRRRPPRSEARQHHDRRRTATR